jgi:hypothetical protein
LDTIKGAGNFIHNGYWGFLAHCPVPSFLLVFMRL